MSPNNLLNGINFSAVIIAAVLWVFGFVFLRMTLKALKYYKEVEDADEDKKGEAYREFILRILVMSGLFLTGLYLAFVGHGSAPAPNLPGPEDDGFTQQVQEMPDESTDPETYNTKQPSVLDKVNEHASDPVDVDAEIKEAIEQSKELQEK